MTRANFLILSALLLAGSEANAADPPAVQVMIVGGFHMANPGRDIHNMHVDDMLAPKRQAEIAAVVDGIARFHPTMADVEDDAPVARQKYLQYLNGTLPPSPNEVVQLGFRLAKQMHLSTVEGIDVEGDFPYDAVQSSAKAHGRQKMLADASADVDAQLKTETDVLAHGPVAALLRHLNEPARIAHDHDFYRRLLSVGAGSEQPGADLLTAWYKRNFYICANLVQLAKPGDRVVVFYGAGHAFLLRQCAGEMPGYRLIEANEYLPR